MNKKCIVVFVVLLVVATSAFFVYKSEEKLPIVAEVSSLEDDAPLMINSLKYHKNMAKAQMPKILFEIPFGKEEENVGGFMEDLERYTEGMPWTFRLQGNDKIWVLDSINKRLKLFSGKNKVEDTISLSDMGANIMDFAVYKNETFAFFNNITGEIFVTDKDGNLKNTLRGFVTASSIEFASNGELLITLPVAKGKVRIDLVGQLRGIYPSNETITIIESNSGGLYGLEFNNKKAELKLQKDYYATSTIKLAEFEYELNHSKDVWFAGGDIYGCDAKGNLYLGLIVCDIEGVIYRERIYMCTPEGKILDSIDIISSPVLSSNVPRKRVVTPDGRILTAHYKEDFYVICSNDFR